MEVKVAPAAAACCLPSSVRPEGDAILPLLHVFEREEFFLRQEFAPTVENYLLRGQYLCSLAWKEMAIMVEHLLLRKIVVFLHIARNIFIRVVESVVREQKSTFQSY